MRLIRKGATRWPAGPRRSSLAIARRLRSWRVRARRRAVRSVRAEPAPARPPAAAVGGRDRRPAAAAPRVAAEPPAASLAVEGGDPVVGQLGSFTWGDGGSDSPWLPGAPIPVGAGERLTVAIADGVGVGRVVRPAGPRRDRDGRAPSGSARAAAITFGTAEPGVVGPGRRSFADERARRPTTGWSTCDERGHRRGTLPMPMPTPTRPPRSRAAPGRRSGLPSLVLVGVAARSAPARTAHRRRSGRPTASSPWSRTRTTRRSSAGTTAAGTDPDHPPQGRRDLGRHRAGGRPGGHPGRRHDRDERSGQARQAARLAAGRGGRPDRRRSEGPFYFATWDPRAAATRCWPATSPRRRHPGRPRRPIGRDRVRDPARPPGRGRATGLDRRRPARRRHRRRRRAADDDRRYRRPASSTTGRPALACWPPPRTADGSPRWPGRAPRSSSATRPAGWRATVPRSPRSNHRATRPPRSRFALDPTGQRLVDRLGGRDGRQPGRPRRPIRLAPRRPAEIGEARGAVVAWRR